MLRRLESIVILAALLVSPAVLAHGGEAHAGRTPPARTLEVSGIARTITVTDATTGAVHVYPTLTGAGGRYLLRGIAASSVAAGSTYRIAGRASLSTLDIDTASREGSATLDAKSAALRTTVNGTLRLGHADGVDGAPSTFFYAVVADDGHMTTLPLAQELDTLANGMKVAATGTPAEDGAMFADDIIILERPPVRPAQDLLAAPVTNQVLVIPIKFPNIKTTPYTYNVDPFSTTSITDAVFGASPKQSAAEYYRDVSFGSHLLAGEVASVGGAWLKANGIIPLDINGNKQCDFGLISSLAEAAATAAGYKLANYTNLVYVFESAPFNCSWSGLAYVGWGRAYIKQTTDLLVIAHELGHNYGLLHAASLDCGANVVGGTCSSAEYGDPFDVMGYYRAMHFNAFQKNYLGWIPSTSVYSHTSGTQTYTISPIETGGAAHYAVKVPANRYRSYWIEFRQPLGFDAALSSFPVGGAQIHLASPFESLCAGCGDDTEYLDMTPGTSAFTDGALLPGQTFTDEFGASINVVSATSTALTVQVTAPSRPTFADVPTSYAAYVPIETLYWNLVTKGCAGSPLVFCPNDMVTRAQMAVFMEREKRGISYVYKPTGKFSDVPVTDSAAGAIEQFYADGIDPGCATDPLRFCPTALVTRAQMAVMLIKGVYGSSYTPAAAKGTVFTDVPKSHPQAAWIEMLAAMGVTKGCTATAYCPDLTVTRAQMAAFFQREFSLPTPP